MKISDRGKKCNMRIREKEEVREGVGYLLVFISGLCCKYRLGSSSNII